MDFRSRLLARCSKQIPEGSKNKLDLQAGELLERLILFEEYIIDSYQLQEIAALIDIFGYDPVTELLKSRFIKFHSETFAGHGSTGRTSSISPSRARKGDLPYYSYCIDALEVASKEILEKGDNYIDRQKLYVSRNLDQFQNIKNLSRQQIEDLKELVYGLVIHLPSEQACNDITKQSYSDFKNSDPLIKTGITTYLSNYHKRELDVNDIDLRIEFIDDTDFRVNSNLKELLSTDDVIADSIIERALLSITNNNHLIAQMKEFQCLVAYRENEVPLFSEKLNFLLEKTMNNKKLEENFQEIISAKGLPDFEAAATEGKIDLIKLLEIRESKECQEFRDWLWRQESVDRAELKDRLNSLSQRFSDFRTSGSGKLFSILLSNGLGIIVGLQDPIAGAATSLGLSAIDSFLLDKILPRSGALTFINNKIPSIYKLNEETENKR
jgi:hypothetical protein